jgi:hypothetical protein
MEKNAATLFRVDSTSLKMQAAGVSKTSVNICKYM